MKNREIKKCKDCGKPFSISDTENEWLIDRGLEPFKRCGECRKRRKNAACKNKEQDTKSKVFATDFFMKRFLKRE